MWAVIRLTIDHVVQPNAEDASNKIWCWSWFVLIQHVTLSFLDQRASVMRAHRLPEFKSGKSFKRSWIFNDQAQSDKHFSRNRPCQLKIEVTWRREYMSTRDAKRCQPRDELLMTTPSLAQRLMYISNSILRKVLYRDQDQFFACRKYCFLGGHQPQIRKMRDTSFGKTHKFNEYV